MCVCGSVHQKRFGSSPKATRVLVLAPVLIFDGVILAPSLSWPVFRPFIGGPTPPAPLDAPAPVPDSDAGVTLPLPRPSVDATLLPEPRPNFIKASAACLLLVELSVYFRVDDDDGERALVPPGGVYGRMELFGIVRMGLVCSCTSSEALSSRMLPLTPPPLWRLSLTASEPDPAGVRLDRGGVRPNRFLRARGCFSSARCPRRCFRRSLRVSAASYTPGLPASGPPERERRIFLRE